LAELLIIFLKPQPYRSLDKTSLIHRGFPGEVEVEGEWGVGRVHVVGRGGGGKSTPCL